MIFLDLHKGKKELLKMDINTNNLENALGGEQRNENAPQMSKEMEIGFHQGALNTLAAERQALFEMIQNVEAFMQGHIKRLEDLGVKTQKKE